ncbi:hypothetical protein [Mycolicibacterium sp. S3B2]|uniref:hypothetical protein n=1 Tax=Mycolicibacterium sp. S3B2 TaxID=3415120 RepID=UPI003C7E46CC
MVKLIEERVEKLKMPSGATVELDTAVTGGMAEDMFDERGQLKAPVSTILSNQIRSWDYEDGHGSIAEINQKNIRRIPPADFNFLAEKVMAPLGMIAEAQVLPDEKKD